MDNMMNVIFGTDEGHFTLTFFWFKGKERKSKKYQFPANKPKECLPILQKMVKLHGKINCVLTSSSMDFCKEENVTPTQVNALWKELGMEK